MKKTINRKPGFLNQLERRKLKRLGIIKPKPETRPPSNVSIPRPLEIEIPSDPQILAALTKGVKEKVAESIKPGEPGWDKKGSG